MKVLKTIACVFGVLFLVVLGIIGLALLIGGVAGTETAMTLTGAILLAISVVGMIPLLKCIPKKEKEQSGNEPKQTESASNGVPDVQQTISENNAKTNSFAQMKANKNIIVCKTCGAKISRRAKRCPHCGERTPGETASQIAIGIIVGPFIAILILVGIAFWFGFFGGFSSLL